MTQSDRWKLRPTVSRYRTFCDELRLKYPHALPKQIMLVFYLPMPSSWSKKKKERNKDQPHEQRPDLDNLIKAVLDALCVEDSYIYELHAYKRWADKGCIFIGNP